MTDFDPTTNRIPFGLLSADERTALVNWKHGFECYVHSEWDKTDKPSWLNHSVYRGKPAPVVTSEWLNVYPQGVVPATHYTREKADKAADDNARIAVLRIDTCNGVSTAHLEDAK